VSTAIEPSEFRRILGHWPSGVVVVTAMGADGPVGMSCSSFTSVSLDPPLIGFFPAVTSTTWPVIREAGLFTVNVLAHHHEELSRSFSQKGIDRFAEVPWHQGEAGPVIDDAAAWIACELYDELPAGDHTLVLGTVLALSAAEQNGPLVFHRGGYARLA
jgi:3-hydroxy-9,10-secoandrosta-1,3,5(10)-triene-9,17-dione monooxygenase reductase component